MKLFSAMYGRLLVWPRHPHAAVYQWHLSGVETVGWLLVALIGLVLLLR
ncbi:MAG: hypothetical protein K9L32_10495 [Chromatiaceae bacterium]|nr:hypothetical protein [Chromatiaceae bacterium]